MVDFNSITRLHLTRYKLLSLKVPASGTGSLSLHFSHKRLRRLQEAAPFSSELDTPTRAVLLLILLELSFNDSPAPISVVSNWTVHFNNFKITQNIHLMPACAKGKQQQLETKTSGNITILNIQMILMQFQIAQERFQFSD